MKSIYLLLSFIALISFTQSNSLQTKRILMILFPGGNTQHKSIKELFDYSINNPSSNYNYEYHLVLYRNDLPLWKVEPSKDYFFYVYGNGSEGLNNFNSISGAFITLYIKWLKEFSRLFLQSNLMSLLQDEQSNNPFDLIATDIPNYVSVLIQQELKVPLKMYLSPRPFPQLFFDLFELNTNYVPGIGLMANDKMNFSQRFNNFFSLIRDKFNLWRLQKEQIALYKQFNFSLKPDLFMRDSFNMIQYPQGLVFPMSVPPNFKFLNAISIKQGQVVNDKTVIEFIDQYKRIIYLSQEAFQLASISVLNEIGLKGNVGFIIQSNVTQKESNMPLMSTNTDGLDILSLKETTCLISTGNIELITQSLYNHKPMILISNGLMQNNIISFAINRGIGVKVDALSSKDILTEYINTVCLNEKDNHYKSNAKVIGNILKGNKDAKQEYVLWLDYGFKFSYVNLIVPLYLKGNWFNINCLDVFFFVIVIIVAIILLLRFILNSMFGTCKKDKRRSKTKQD